MNTHTSKELKLLSALLAQAQMQIREGKLDAAANLLAYVHDHLKGDE